MRSPCFSLAFLLLSATFSHAQLARPSERQVLIQQIETFFDAMRSGDTAQLRQQFHPEASMFTVLRDSSGRAEYRPGDVEKFLQSVGAPREAVLDERIYSYKVQVDGAFADVFTDYAFYLGDQFLHCGINDFEFIRQGDTWLILKITDTRHKDDCAQSPEANIHQLLDNWHRAAATADEDTFFGSMTPQAVYLGTDASERWLRDELREWSAEYFAKESAWDFTPSARQLAFSQDRTTAWFDEKLDTWMGTCFGSGVVVLTPEGWKIAHYHLAFTVPNERMDSVLKLLSQE